MNRDRQGAGPPLGPAGAESPHARELRLDGERFRLLVENSLDLIVELSPAVDILYVSPNVAAVLGHCPAELIGTNVFDRIHPDDRDHVKEQFERHSGAATCRYRHRDGGWRWLEGTGREFLTPQGAAHRVLVVRDVTSQREAAAERERLRAELARAERLTALGILAGGMAHDVNNVLTAIASCASLALLDMGHPEARPAVEQILKAAERAGKIARQVLEFNGPRRGIPAPVGLGAVAEEVLGLLRPTVPCGVDLASNLPAEGGWVLGNATQLHQVLINLCQNAIHALPESRGRILVAVEPVHVDECLAREHRGLRCGPHVRLSVVDDGRGMDEATLQRIFEPFFTTKPEGMGTGLGLAVVQRVVRDHGGVIHVTSAPGKGTVFRIYFPAHGGAS